MTLKKKLAAALTTAGLAAGLCLAGTGTARADVTPPAGQWKGIANLHLNGRGTLLCFEDPGGSTANGAQSQLGYCHPYNSDGTLQRWLFIQAVDSNGNPITEGGGNKVYYLYNLAAQRCLGVTATRVGQPLILTDCVANSTTVALWELRPTGGGPSLQDFQLALYIFDDWCIAANVADDIVPNGLGLAGCNANDARQLWALW